MKDVCLYLSRTLAVKEQRAIAHAINPNDPYPLSEDNLRQWLNQEMNTLINNAVRKYEKALMYVQVSFLTPVTPIQRIAIAAYLNPGQFRLDRSPATVEECQKFFKDFTEDCAMECALDMWDYELQQIKEDPQLRLPLVFEEVKKPEKKPVLKKPKPEKKKLELTPEQNRRLIREYLLTHGPQHVSDLCEKLKLTKGCVEYALRSNKEEFEQNESCKWSVVVADPKAETESESGWFILKGSAKENSPAHYFSEEIDGHSLCGLMKGRKGTQVSNPENQLLCRNCQGWIRRKQPPLAAVN